MSSFYALSVVFGIGAIHNGVSSALGIVSDSSIPAELLEPAGHYHSIDLAYSANKMGFVFSDTHEKLKKL